MKRVLWVVALVGGLGCKAEPTVSEPAPAAAESIVVPCGGEAKVGQVERITGSVTNSVRGMVSVDGKPMGVQAGRGRETFDLRGETLAVEGGQIQRVKITYLERTFLQAPLDRALRHSVVEGRAYVVARDGTVTDANGGAVAAEERDQVRRDVPFGEWSKMTFTGQICGVPLVPGTRIPATIESDPASSHRRSEKGALTLQAVRGDRVEFTTVSELTSSTTEPDRTVTQSAQAEATAVYDRQTGALLRNEGGGPVRMSITAKTPMGLINSTMSGKLQFSYVRSVER